MRTSSSRCVRAPLRAPAGARRDPRLPRAAQVSNRGYVKRMSPETFAAQQRRTRGKAGGRIRDGDALMIVMGARSSDAVLFFTERGRALRLPAHRIPEESRSSGGTPLPQLVKLLPAEAVTAAMPVAAVADTDSLVLATERGVIKRMLLRDFSGAPPARASAAGGSA